MTCDIFFNSHLSYVCICYLNVYQEFNKHFKTKLKARQFTLVEILENIENTTGEAGVSAKVNVKFCSFWSTRITN